MKKVIELLNDIRPDLDFENLTNFIESGYLDSFDIVNLVDKIEEEYDIIIDALDIVPENFDTIKAIEDLIKNSDNN